jgi:hypothetical protein
MTFEIGGNDLDVKTRMAYMDTFSVKTYTVMLDSIATSGLSSPSVMIGNFFDPLVGTISASSFFRFMLNGPDGINYNIDQAAVFDSLKLYMVYDGYYEGDTTAPFTINVYRLNQDLKSNTDGYFYNNDSIGCSPELFGKTTFLPHPNSPDSIYITLDSTFGKELFSLMKVNNEKVKNSEDWLRYFRGLMVRFDESNNAILGFSFPVSTSDTLNIALRVYYHYVDDLSIIPKEYDFKAQPVLQFNQFTLSNSVVGFPMNQMAKLPSSATNNTSYIYSGIGLVTRIEIPYIKNLLYIDNDVRILDAQLEIEPSNYTYDDIELPPRLSLITTDNNNRWGSLVYNKFNNEQTGNLVIDELYQEDTKYTFDITPFLSSRLSLETDMIPAMLLSVSSDDFYKRTRRAIIGSQNNEVNKVKLKVYYMNINEQ